MPRDVQVEVFPGHDGRAFLRVRGRNGHVIKGSESPHGYVNASNARRAARKLHPDVKVVTLKG